MTWTLCYVPWTFVVDHDRQKRVIANAKEVGVRCSWHRDGSLEISAATQDLVESFVRWVHQHENGKLPEEFAPAADYLQTIAGCKLEARKLRGQALHLSPHRERLAKLLDALVVLPPTGSAGLTNRPVAALVEDRYEGVPVDCRIGRVSRFDVRSLVDVFNTAVQYDDAVDHLSISTHGDRTLVCGFSSDWLYTVIDTDAGSWVERFPRHPPVDPEPKPTPSDPRT